MFKKLFGLLLMFALFACEGAPPEINDIFYQITLSKNLTQNRSEEILSLFLTIHDEDGEDDIESIYLLNDQQELFWKLDSSNWEKTDRKGSRWIGSSSIQMADGSPFPRGKYRVLVSDQGGSRGEKELQLNVPGVELNQFIFPELSFHQKTAQVVGGNINQKFLYFNASGRFLYFHFVPQEELNFNNFPRIQELKEESNNRVYLYHFENEEGYGVMVGPYSGIYERLSP